MYDMAAVFFGGFMDSGESGGDVLIVHDSIVDNYSTFVRTFTRSLCQLIDYKSFEVFCGRFFALLKWRLTVSVF